MQEVLVQSAGKGSVKPSNHPAPESSHQLALIDRTSAASSSPLIQSFFIPSRPSPQRPRESRQSLEQLRQVQALIHHQLCAQVQPAMEALQLRPVLSATEPMVLPVPVQSLGSGISRMQSPR